MSARESRPAEAAPESLTKGSTDILTAGTVTGRFNRHDVRAHRSIVRELDEWFGIFHYGDPAVIYAMPPSREAESE
jgi:hypothetical protein